GRIRDLDAALLAIVDGHAVVTHAENRNDLELRKLIEQRRLRDGTAALHESANLATASREQMVLIGRSVIIVATIIRLKWIVEKRRQRRGDDDVGLRHGSALFRDGVDGEPF